MKGIKDANDARKEGMSLTPRVRVEDGVNYLLAWEETVAMHEAEAREAAEEPAAQEPAQQEAKPAKEPKPKTTRRKTREPGEEG